MIQDPIQKLSALRRRMPPTDDSVNEVSNAVVTATIYLAEEAFADDVEAKANAQVIAGQKLLAAVYGWMTTELGETAAAAELGRWSAAIMRSGKRCSDAYKRAHGL